MPKVDGLQLCRRLHKFCDIPVIMLTAMSEERTVARSIRDVAEDYVVKPFRPQELLARVERILRRMADFSYALGRHTVIDDYLSIDFPGQAVSVDGQTRELTPTETKILFILVRNSGRTTTADYLVRRIWPMKEVFEDTLRVHVHRLRHKLEPEPSRPVYLVTKRGRGYSFSSPSKGSKSA